MVAGRGGEAEDGQGQEANPGTQGSLPRHCRQGQAHRRNHHGNLIDFLVKRTFVIYTIAMNIAYTCAEEQNTSL